MTRKPYLGPSDSQANADALYRRDHTWTAPHEASVRVAWDWHRRDPEDLREAVRMARRAYSDEVPAKLHEGADSIGPDGTPKMTARAEGYIFGSAQADDSKRGQCVCHDLMRCKRRPEDGWDHFHEPHEDSCPRHPKNRDLVGYYFAPFRAKLDEWQHGDEGCRKRAAIVAHVTIGSQGPQQAAIAEGVPSWCAKVVAEDALRSFLRAMTDLRLHVRNQEEAVA